MPASEILLQKIRRVDFQFSFIWMKHLFNFEKEKNSRKRMKFIVFQF